jgi:N6-L-threonylcarbamoyladenine synthase
LFVCLDQLNAVALTIGPGLPFSLEVGLQKAKELTMKHKKPLITVNHMEGHALVVRLIDSK